MELSEQRERELARSHNARIGSPFTTKVVGVTFAPGYPENLTELREVMGPRLPSLPYPMFQGEMAQHYAERDWEEYEERRARQTEHPVAILIRNPDNEHDPNAIQVHVPALGEDHSMIGHLTGPIAARLAPEMDAGGRWRAHVESVLIDERYPDRPGISIFCARVVDDDEVR